MRITPAQRDALYDQILARLSGLDGVWLAVCAENYAAARRLAIEYSDDLRLVSDDLGWGDGPGEEIELTAPPDVLRRAFSRHFQEALRREANDESEISQLKEAKEQAHLVVQACRRVLAELDGPQRLDAHGEA